MDNLIASYFAQFGEIPIPHIGKIYLKKESASLDFASQQMMPPVYHVQLEEMNVDNPERLIDYIALAGHMSESEASAKLQAWNARLTAGLAAGQEAELPFIGKLIRLEDGKIRLQPYEMLSVLQPVAANRIDMSSPLPKSGTDQEATVEEPVASSEEDAGEESPDEPEGENAFTEREQTPWWIAALIIFLVSLSVILFVFFFNGSGAKISSHDAPPTYRTR